jgi:hypothetical protein
MQLLWRLIKPFNGKLLITAFLSLSLVIGGVAFADDKNGEGAPDSTHTGSTGTRLYQPPGDLLSPFGDGLEGRRGGCTGDAEISLTALAPQSHVGQTASTHPTFAWFVPDAQPIEIIFQVYEYGSNGSRDVIQEIPLQSSPGIMTLSLPKDEPGLSVGQRYGWRVVLLCNPNSPSSALVAGADIDVVSLPATFSDSLDPLEKAKQYAEAGLWYDALAEVLASGKEASILLEDLLKDLAELENLQAAKNGSEQGQRLTQVVEKLRR